MRQDKGKGTILTQGFFGVNEYMWVCLVWGWGGERRLFFLYNKKTRAIVGIKVEGYHGRRV